MSGHIGKVEICSSCTKPVHVDVCNFPVPEPDREYSETVWCVGGVPLVRVSQWLDSVQVVSWTTTTGSPIAPSTASINAATFGACSGATNDFEVIERFVCSAGVTLVQRTLFTSGVAAAPTYFGLNGAAVAAPATFTEGPCDDQDIDLEVEYVCAAGVTLIRRRIVDGETGALISETFSGTNGAAVAAPATYTMGNCSGFGTYPVLRCGATSNVTTTANVQATRVALENDVILTKSCPTTSALTNNLVSVAPNAAVTQAATAVPTNARGVTVYNVTRARIAFTISSHGTITIPPNGTWSGNLPDNVPPYSGTWSIATQAGNAGPAVFAINPAVQIDWVTRV